MKFSIHTIFTYFVWMDRNVLFLESVRIHIIFSLKEVTRNESRIFGNKDVS